MGGRLTAKSRRLLDGANFAHLATLLPDGSPHVTPVWVDREGDEVHVNTSEDRVKTRNVRRDARVALSVTNEGDPYERVVIRGRVTEVTREGAEEHIDRLARKYLGRDFPRIPGQVRVLFRIEATHVVD